MYRKKPLASAIGCILGAGTLLAPGAFAQEAPTDDEAREIEEVVVTGSRLRRDSFSTAVPMDVVLADAAVAQGISDVGTLLQTTTVAAGSAQVTSATSTAFVQNGGIGATTLSLRGLGANRTLTLLNGRRAGPSGTRGGTSSFDLNVLPLAALERVEILKDGASSVYGSDAVAGVVNFITKKGDGGSLDVFTSQPGDSGGEEFRVSGSWGRSSDRGNFRITGDYFRENELARGDRSYFNCGEQFIFDPDTGQRRDTIDPRTGSPRCNDLLWGHVWLYDYAADSNVPAASSLLAQFDYDGDLANYIPGYAVDPTNPEFLSTPPGWFPVNYDIPSDGVANADHPFQDAESLIPQTELFTVYAEGELDIGESTTLYSELLLNRRETKANGYRQFWTYIYNENWNFSGDIAPGNGSTLSQGWTGAQWMSPTPITDHNDSVISVDYARFLSGIRGDLTDNWGYDVNFQYSISDGDYTSDQIFEDSIQDQWFAGGSCAGQVTSVRGAPCVDVPWLNENFLAGEIPANARQFLFGRETGNTEYTQWSIEAYVTGDLFEMPAGSVATALGVHYRADEIEDVPGAITLAGNAWQTSEAGITAGEDDTKAIFAEMEMPLLRDKAFAEDLSLTVSGRWTEVDSYGDGTTYKASINWQMLDSLRFRASNGTSFRTPALFELYLANETSSVRQTIVDPCIRWEQNAIDGNITQEVANNCAADGVAPDHSVAISGTAIAGGGVGLLDAEESESTTVGLIWQPEFTELSFSIDYFDIEVEDEIAQLGARNIVRGCYQSDFFPNEPLCDLFERRSFDNGVDNVRDSFINIATQRSKGYDIAAVWRTDIGNGSLEFDAQVTVQTDDERALFEDQVEELNGEFGEPEVVGRLFTSYDHGPWSFLWTLNYVGDVSNVDSFGGDTSTYRGETVRVVLDADEVLYHAFSATYDFEDSGVRAVLGVANAFDEEPPQVTTLNLGELNTVGTSAFYSQYDWFGRRVYANVIWDFGE